MPLWWPFCSVPDCVCHVLFGVFLCTVHCFVRHSFISLAILVSFDSVAPAFMCLVVDCDLSIHLRRWSSISRAGTMFLFPYICCDVRFLLVYCTNVVYICLPVQFVHMSHAPCVKIAPLCPVPSTLVCSLCLPPCSDGVSSVSCVCALSRGSVLGRLGRQRSWTGFRVLRE